MEMNNGSKPRYSAITLGIVLLTAFVLVQPAMQNTYAQVGVEGAPNYFDCRFKDVDQLSDPFEMDTVRSGKIAKTIIAEKEIFKCQTEQGNIDVLVDVTTVAEILEDMNTKTVISKQAHVIYCVKLAPLNQGINDFPGGDATLLGCDTDVPDTDFVPVSNCWEEEIDEPQEVNTVNKGKTVKTIVAQKEIFVCIFGEKEACWDYCGRAYFDSDDKKVEQYIIEEIWEDLRLAPSDTVVQQNVESLRCTILITDAFVESCRFTEVQVQEFVPEE